MIAVAEPSTTTARPTGKNLRVGLFASAVRCGHLGQIPFAKRWYHLIPLANHTRTMDVTDMFAFCLPE